MKKYITLITLLICTCGMIHAQSTATLISQANKQTDPAQKVRLLTLAVQKDPDAAEAWHNRGDVYREQHKLSAAIDDYTKAIQLTPKDPFRYYARALAYMDAKKYTLASTDLTKSSISPNTTSTIIVQLIPS